MRNKRILVTGGAGYIGSVLVPMLLNYGAMVTVIDNLMYKQTSLLNHIWRQNFNFIYGDVTNRNFLDDHLAEYAYDVVIPLAALVGVSACDKNIVNTYEVNKNHVIQLCRYCEAVGATMIYPNTNSGYGAGKHSVDGKPIFCTEEDRLDPISYYGRSKMEAEQYVTSYLKNYVFRLATVFGPSPRMRLDLMVNDFVYKAMTDRSIVLFESGFYRNVVHVFDVCRAFAAAIFGDIDPGVYNLGLPTENITKLELAQRIKKFIPDFCIVEDEFNEDLDKRNYVVSNQKILDQDFDFDFTLDDGINQLIKTYKYLIPLTKGFTNA